MERMSQCVALPRSDIAASHSAEVGWHRRRYCRDGFPEKMGVATDPSAATFVKKMGIVAPDPAAEDALGACNQTDGRTWGPHRRRGVSVETYFGPPGSPQAAVGCCKGPELAVKRTSPSCVGEGGTGERSLGPALGDSR